MKGLKLGLGALVTFAMWSGALRAQQEPLPPPAKKTINFTTDVDPILAKYCYACHGPDNAMNGYSMWRSKSAIRGGYSGRPAIKPGNSRESRLIQLVAGREENLIMPPAGGPLNAEEIGVLRAWIDQGVKWGPGRAEAEEEKKTEWLEMDYGGLISASITVRKPKDPRADKRPGDNVAYKAHAISLTPGGDAAVLFDTELLRYAAGWTGGFLVLTGTVYDWRHGPHPYADGRPVFETPVAPGWSLDGDFSDPRASGFGPLPRKLAHYRGRYVHGDRNILSYTVGGTGVLDMPSFERAAGFEYFKRVLDIDPHRRDLLLEVAAKPGENPAGLSGGLNGARLGKLAALVSGPGASWETGTAGHLRLRIPAASRRESFAIYLAEVPASMTAEFASWAGRREPSPSLAELTHGGPARYARAIKTKGTLGAGSEPWLVDEITLPFDNPWKSWMRPGDFGFFSDNRAAMTTWSGDVWIVSGVDDNLDELVWRRYATGFHQPLGLEVVDDQVFVLDRNQITRLHDLNGDGEADFYENFNNDFEATHHFHEFTFDLDRDPAGNFYFAKAARHALPAKVKHHGTIMKLDPAGERLEIVCKGFRVPNGVAVSPEGYITTSDQEGHWIPSTPIAWCTPGSYHGYAWGGGVDPARADDYTPPLTYLPIEVDNSGAGQAWVPDDRWGPFRGHLVHSSFGQGKLYLVLAEKLNDGTVQGGAYVLPVDIDTGLMRPDFRASDGQLYVCGLKGWGTTKKATGGFYRIRYTGRPVTLPDQLRVNKKEGIAVRFTRPLDPKSARNAANYAVRRWNYRRSSRYGSDTFKLNGERGIDTAHVLSARLSEDRRTVFLALEDLREVMQMQVGINVKAADGTTVSVDLYHTINELAREPGRPILSGRP